MLLCKIHAQRGLFLGPAVALLLLPLWAPSASAQSQGDSTSVADAARRAREQKKTAAKPVRTLTNDDLSAASDKAAQAAAATAPTDSTTSGQAKPEAEAAAPTTASPEPAGPTEDSSKKRARIETTVKRAKAELAQAQSELDVLQRKAALDNDSYYSKTDYARDTEGKARLDADAQQVNDKKSQVDDLKAKLAALQAELGEDAETEKPAQPQ